MLVRRVKKKKDVLRSLSQRELREYLECLDEYAPMTPEQARELVNSRGGWKKMTLELYEACMQKRRFKLAAKLVAHVTARAHDPDPEIARMNADILASMKHDA